MPAEDVVRVVTSLNRRGPRPAPLSPPPARRVLKDEYIELITGSFGFDPPADPGIPGSRMRGKGGLLIGTSAFEVYGEANPSAVLLFNRDGVEQDRASELYGVIDSIW